MPTTWWQSERSTEPPVITIIPTESRKVAIGLAGALNMGEAILGGTIVAEVRRWRDNLPLDPQPIFGTVSYDAPTMTAAVGIDGDLLPYGEPCALIVTFDVSYGSGTDTRSSFLIVIAKL